MLQIFARSFGRNLSPRTQSSLLHQRRCNSKFSLVLGDHVKEAIRNGTPILGLESTVITHGMPEPMNLELGKELEKIAMNQKVVPATVGIVKGQLVVGLSAEQIEFLAKKELSRPVKASRRDLPLCMGLGLSAGTTVAGTISLLASINNNLEQGNKGAGSPLVKIFATGGVGGVHLGGENSLDISADLYEFSRSPINVISSGFKSFLSTKLSLEYLETMGCTVMSLHVNDEASEEGGTFFPGFYNKRNKENVLSPWPVRDIDEAVKIFYHNLEGPQTNKRGALLAVPTPKEVTGQPDLDNILAQVSEEIDKRTDLGGKDKTPLMLERLNSLTKNETLKANIELLKNNALIGAQVALKYSQMASGRAGAMLPPSSDTCCTGGNGSHQLLAQGQKATTFDIAVPTAAADGSASSPGPVIFGCTMVDMHVSTRIPRDHFKKSQRSGVTFPASAPHFSCGGVGRNLAVALDYLGLAGDHKRRAAAPIFVTALARDFLGSFARSELSRHSPTFVESSRHLQVCSPTGDTQSPFALVLTDELTGQCECVIADLAAVGSIEPGKFELIIPQLREAPLILLDANLSAPTIDFLVEFSHLNRVPIFIEPTDVLALDRLAKCLTEAQTKQSLSQLICLSPNLLEFQTLLQKLEGGKDVELVDADALSVEQVARMARGFMQEHLTQLRCLLITMGERGTIVAARTKRQNTLETIQLTEEICMPFADAKNIQVKHFPVPKKVEQPVSAVGCGDVFAAGFATGLIRGQKLIDCLELGFRASYINLHSRDSVSAELKNLS